MSNRLLDYLEEEPEEEEVLGEYFEVRGEWSWSLVSRETAQWLKARISRRWRPRWLRFRDLFGAEVQVRAADIRSIEESTSEARSRVRDFRRAHDAEEKADKRPWEDND